MNTYMYMYYVCTVYQVILDDLNLAKVKHTVMSKLNDTWLQFPKIMKQNFAFQKCFLHIYCT